MFTRTYGNPIDQQSETLPCSGVQGARVEEKRRKLEGGKEGGSRARKLSKRGSFSASLFFSLLMILFLAFPVAIFM